MHPRTVSTQAVRLRPPGAGDIEPIFRACQDPEIPRWTVNLPEPYGYDDARHFVEVIAADGWRSGADLNWVITRPDADELLGVVGLKDIAAGSGEIGYWLAAWARGAGIATAAVAGACEYAFQQLGLGVVRWQAIAGNDASRRVAERVGFRIEGPLPGVLLQRGVRRDAWVGSLQPADLALAPRLL